MKHTILIILATTTITISCENEPINNPDSTEFKITDIQLSDCEGRIPFPMVSFTKLNDSQIKITHIGAEFCCGGDNKDVSIEYEKLSDSYIFKEIDTGADTDCYCKHNLEFTVNNIQSKEFIFKIIESESANQRDTLEAIIDLKTLSDTLIEYKGDVLFCTNAGILNCPSAIELSIDGEIMDTLTAKNIIQSENDCGCPATFSNGLKLELAPGNHNFVAREINCSASNAISEWIGSFSLEKDSCERFLLNVDEAPILVRTSKEEYLPDEQVIVEVTNASDSIAEYFICSPYQGIAPTIQKLENENWVHYWSPVCDAFQSRCCGVFEAGKSYSDTLGIGFSPGKYKITYSFKFQPDQEYETFYSNTFQID
ncbi:MAG: hypothetical protein ACOC0C_04985 [Bacteroidota bacterium]